MKIIGFVGLPGSGKGVASDVARQMGIRVLVMGDVIRSEAARLRLAPSDENLGAVGNTLRAQEGPAAVARRTLQKAAGETIIVVDGLRSQAEADFFRAAAEEFHLVEITAPGESRMKWITARGRPDDPRAVSSFCTEDNNHAAIEQRDSRELSWGMCEAMRMADVRLKNDGNLEQFRGEVRELLKAFISPQGH